jgi:hypothetical protein
MLLGEELILESFLIEALDSSMWKKTTCKPQSTAPMRKNSRVET